MPLVDVLTLQVLFARQTGWIPVPGSNGFRDWWALDSLADTCLTGERGIVLIAQIAAVGGYPHVLPSSNGTEFVCTATADWAKNRIGLALIPSVTLWNNGKGESHHVQSSGPCRLRPSHALW